jgi:hypothetical protein
VHLVLGLRPFDGMADVGRRGVADGVELLGPVEHEARDARVLRVLVDENSVESGHGCLLGFDRVASILGRRPARR